jgi:hypothetical protein
VGEKWEAIDNGYGFLFGNDKKYSKVDCGDRCATPSIC